MAMRKEPGRRYASVDQLREDIQRRFEGLPVLAREDSLVYRASRFLRRHAFVVTAAAAVMISILAAL